MKRMSTCADLAEIFGVKPNTIGKWADSGYITAAKIGNKWRFDLNDVEKWVESKKQPGRKTQTPKLKIHKIGGRKKVS